MSDQRGGGAPPGWWPPPPATPESAEAAGASRAFPHERPMPYHLMLRNWDYAWWRPVVGIVVFAVAAVVVVPTVLLPVLAGVVALRGGSFTQALHDIADLAHVGPPALLYLNLSLASLVLVAWFVMRVLHRMRPRWLASVQPRLRWRFLLACVGLSVIALIAQIVVASLLPGPDSGLGDTTLNHFTPSSLTLGLVVLLTTPLQAAGEEYAFRGYLLCAFGSLFANKYVALLITAVLFALAHGGQNFPLFFDRFMFGLIAGILVLRTGGLEAGIAMHILNNFLAFGAAILFGNIGDSLNVSQASWWNLPVTLTQSGVYLLLVLWAAKKFDLQTRTRPPSRPTPTDDTVVQTPVR